MIGNIDKLYERLEANMDNRVWWDTENLWEIVVGAILVQNTNWKNVDYSLDNIREAIGFIPEKLAAIDILELQELIRPSGFYKNKSRALKEIFAWFETYNFDIAAIQQKDLPSLREELLSIRGIGQETADVLLIFVFNKVSFIADRYAQRIFNQLGLEEMLNYSKLQAMIKLPTDFTNQQAQNFHGWLVDYGQIHLKSEEAWEAGFLSDFELELV
ncbi:deoxyribonuclease I [Enterococcus sp. 669A]|uniref:Deoxyribonuclease I n=1 Tax=Candidatus Enterococcus moelleringii TaxID=2815325 RepID=A0ABS3LFT4_9ENTE|nr:deoxyribonuclease I [Enterococcus sp. 669A]MBO1307878.1 deoxyribonuclease I [Enterococcus sp. 669A]